MDKGTDIINITNTKKLYRKGSYMDNDLLLFDEVAELPLPSDPRKMDCILMALCLRGKVQYTIDTVEHTVNAGDMIIVSEGQVIADYLMSRDCSGIAVMISGDFFREVIAGVHEMSSLFIFSRSHPVCSLHNDEAKNIISYYHLLKQKVNDKHHHFRRDMVRMLMGMVVYDLSNVIYRIQNTPERKLTRAESIFSKFIQLLEANFKSERRVSWYGRQLCITPKYLSETVKGVSHRTPNEWIDYYITLELRVQLKNTTKSIKEIAQELQFANQSFLGKYFKEHVGMSPSAYRRS